VNAFVGRLEKEILKGTVSPITVFLKLGLFA